MVEESGRLLDRWFSAFHLFFGDGAVIILVEDAE